MLTPPAHARRVQISGGRCVLGQLWRFESGTVLFAVAFATAHPAPQPLIHTYALRAQFVLISRGVLGELFSCERWVHSLPQMVKYCRSTDCTQVDLPFTPDFSVDRL